MKTLILTFTVIVFLGAGTLVRAASDQVVARVRKELAVLLKKEPSSLPLDKPVYEIGADELDIVEWVMAIEEAYRVQIPDEKVVDTKSKVPSKDLSIIVMADIAQAAIDKHEKR